MADIPQLPESPCRGSIRAGAPINREPQFDALGTAGTFPTGTPSSQLLIIGGTVFTRPNNYQEAPPELQARIMPSDPPPSGTVGIMRIEVVLDTDYFLEVEYSDDVTAFNALKPWMFAEIAGRWENLGPPILVPGDTIRFALGPDPISVTRYQAPAENGCIFTGLNTLIYNTFGNVPYQWVEP